MLRLKIKEVLVGQGKKNHRFWLLQNCKFSYGKIQKLYSQKQKSIAFEDLSRLCKALDCTPNELFYWDETPKIVVGDAHPLKTKLTKPDPEANWTARIEGLNPERVEVLKQFLLQLEKEKRDSLNPLPNKDTNPDI